MRQAKTDRRSLRTRQQLMQALIELMRVKRYDAITVQELTEHANVGRSTFYAHFVDKDDLLSDGVHQMLTGLETPDPGRGNRLFPTLALFQHVGAEREMYQVMSRGRALTVFVTALQDQLATILARRLGDRVPAGATPAVSPDLLAVMYAGMLLATMRTWIEDGLTEAAEDIARTFHVAADAAVRAGLRPV